MGMCEFTLTGMAIPNLTTHWTFSSTVAAGKPPIIMKVEHGH